MLPRDYPALGAFLYQPDWERIAEELAYGLRRRINHEDNGCQCCDHLALRVFDEAKRRTRGRRCQSSR